MYRILVAADGLLFMRKIPVDPITRWLKTVITVVYHDMGESDLEYWSRQSSFILAGVIIVGSVRTLLEHIMSAMKTWAFLDQNNIIALVLAQTMGFYLMGSVFLLRASIPSQYGSVITEMLGGIHLEYCMRWFDTIFLYSALASAVLLYFISPPDE